MQDVTAAVPLESPGVTETARQIHMWEPRAYFHHRQESPPSTERGVPLNMKTQQSWLDARAGRSEDDSQLIDHSLVWRESEGWGPPWGPTWCQAWNPGPGHCTVSWSTNQLLAPSKQHSAGRTQNHPGDAEGVPQEPSLTVMPHLCGSACFLPVRTQGSAGTGEPRAEPRFCGRRASSSHRPSPYQKIILIPALQCVFVKPHLSVSHRRYTPPPTTPTVSARWGGSPQR